MQQYPVKNDSHSGLSVTFTELNVLQQPQSTLFFQTFSTLCSSNKHNNEWLPQSEMSKLDKREKKQDGQSETGENRKRKE